MSLDANGRCCGRKPIRYLRGDWTPERRPHLFCDRCCRAYEIDLPCAQIENWAWARLTDGQFVRVGDLGKPLV